MSSKDKKKVLQWQTNFFTDSSKLESSEVDSEIFLVQDVNEAMRLVTIQSTLDEAKWIEDVKVDIKEVWISLLESFQGGREVAVQVYEGEEGQRVLRLHSIT